MSLDDDWYRIELAESERATVEIAFDSRFGSLELQLVEETGFGRLDSGTGGNGRLRVTTPEGPASYLVRVAALREDSVTDYQLTVTKLTEDTYEDNDRSLDAAEIEPGTYNLVLFDDDYFKVVTPGPASLRVTATFVHDQGDIELELYGASTSEDLDASWSATDVETVEGSSESGVFLIRVFGYAGAINAYTLQVEVVPVE